MSRQLRLGPQGRIHGNPAWITNGAIGGALQFFGTNDCVHQSAGSNTLNGLKAFTVALWVKPPATNATEGLLTGDDADTNDTFSLATRLYASCGNNTNVVEVTVPTTGGVVHRASASNALQPGQWQHIAVTWTNGEAPKLYFNGQLDQPSASFVTASGVLTNCPQFIIGKGAFDSPASWSGAIDDVRVFNVALNADEILALADVTTNHAPVVDAGTNVTVQIDVPVTLAGTVTDDGLPNPPGQGHLFLVVSRHQQHHHPRPDQPDQHPCFYRSRRLRLPPYGFRWPVDFLRPRHHHGHSPDRSGHYRRRCGSL